MPTPERQYSPESFEFYLEVTLKQKYDVLVELYKPEWPEDHKSEEHKWGRLDLIKPLPICGEYGIVGIDGNEYPIPSYESIKARFKENKEFKTKFNQGFTELEMIPFALPIELLAVKFGKQILKHHKAGKLFATKASPDDPDEPLELDTNQPLFVWDKWIDPSKPEGERGADVSGECVYHCDNFDPVNHHGHTKQEILAKQREIHDPWAGWEVELIEANPNIPREGKGQTIGGRKQPEAGQTAEQYQRQFQTDPQYRHERAQTKEGWIIQNLVHLEKTNQVIDDWQGKGSVTFLLGSYLPASGYLGYGCWYRGGRRANLGGGDPWNQDSDIGCRSAVGLGQKLEFGD